MFRLRGFVAAIVLWAASVAWAQPSADLLPWPEADVTITDLLRGETEHGKLVYGFASAMTRAGCHVAKLEGERGKMVVRLDGKRGKTYAEIPARSDPVFSPDGSALGYSVFEAGGSFVVINEREGPKFEEIYAKTFTFSADGKRHAYVAKKDGRRVAVIDGVVQADGGGDLLPWLQPPVFSANGSSVGYLEVSLPERKMRAVVNGKPGEAFGEYGLSLWFSPDGLRFSYSAREGERCFHVVDGKKGEAFDNTGIDFVFSPDGKRTAYVGFRGARRFLVVEGAPTVEIEGIVDGTLTFSPDSRRLAYGAARRDRRCYFVVDGKAGPVYDSVGAAIPRGLSPNVTSTQNGYGLGGSGVVFSPDSSRFAYVADTGGKKVVVVDGKPEDVEMDFLVGGIIFSADSRRLAYGGRQGGKFFLVVDGKKGADYDALGHFEFSQDGTHIAFVAKKGDQNVIVVDGKQRAKYIVVPAGPVFRSDGTLEFLATDESSLNRIEVKSP